MPVYFFHIRDGTRLIPDSQGTNFPGLEAARGEARASVRDFAIEALQQRLPVDRLHVEIVDKDGTVLETVRFSDVADGD